MQRPKKVYKLKLSQLKPLAVGYGACVATDRITVDGEKVKFMYRDEPENEKDSGWRFTAGDESDDYMDNPHHQGAYDVNTIANCDPDIIAFLDNPVGSAFERPSGEAPFTRLMGS